MMKKQLLFGLAVLFMLALAGCDDVKDILIGDKPDDPTSTGSWDKNLNDFEVNTGDNPGEILYKFSSITSDTNAVYTLHYVPSTINKADQIIVTGQSKEVSPTSTFASLDGLTAGVTYSLVVQAKKPKADSPAENPQYDIAKSGVKQIASKAGLPQLKLTITGTITSGIITAKLYTNNSGLSVTPVATGSIINNTVKFFDANSSSQFFTTPGQYYITLENAAGTTKLTYKGEAGNDDVKYDFTVDPAPTIDFSKFK